MGPNEPTYFRNNVFSAQSPLRAEKRITAAV